MPNFQNGQTQVIDDFVEIIDPAFIESQVGTAESSPIGWGSGGGYVIQSVNPVEVPMVDGQIGLFNHEGEFLGFK